MRSGRMESWYRGWTALAPRCSMPRPSDRPGRAHSEAITRPTACLTIVLGWRRASTVKIMGAWPGEVELSHGDSELAAKLESALESIQHFRSGCSAAWAETFNRRSERE